MKHTRPVSQIRGAAGAVPPPRLKSRYGAVATPRSGRDGRYRVDAEAQWRPCLPPRRRWTTLLVMPSPSRSRPLRAVVVLAVALTGLRVVGREVHAAPPDQAPAASCAQVAAALGALTTAFRGSRATPGERRTGHAGAAIAVVHARSVPSGARRARWRPRGPVRGARRTWGSSRRRVRRSLRSVRRRASAGRHAPAARAQPVTGAGHVYVARSVAGVVPQAYVSGAQALAACRQAGKRCARPWSGAPRVAAARATPFPTAPTACRGAATTAA